MSDLVAEKESVNYGAIDFKSQSRGNLTKMPSYAAVMIGQYSFYKCWLMNQDDYGNLSNGYWGRSYGYSSYTLKYGAS